MRPENAQTRDNGIMEKKFIKTEALEHRLDIKIDNPPVNIMTGAVMQELIDVLKDAKSNTNIRIIVFKGQGKAWSAGADVGEHLPENFEKMLDVFGELCELIRTFPVLTIAAVGGVCLGGGCEVAGMCDFIVASERAKFGQPEIKVGVFPPVALAHFVTKIGYSSTLELVLSGDIYSAEDSFKMGLVSKLSTEKSLDDDVDALAARFTNNSRAVMELSKSAALLSLAHSPKESATLIDELYRFKLMETEDAIEGLNAFLEKRLPQWKDK